jgi:hypothetical protein
MITTAEAVISLRPGAEWSMNGDDVEGIIWHTKGVEPLTSEEVQAEVNRLENAQAQAEADKKLAKASAIAKLQALGLTVNEVQVAFGLEA